MSQNSSRALCREPKSKCVTKMHGALYAPTWSCRPMPRMVPQLLLSSENSPFDGFPSPWPALRHGFAYGPKNLKNGKT